ncbi:phage antirepressor KilAC domain-containing protein [Edwardsiella tarda]|uniref:phage antirepressor KilAC domain-containing protein n=1 Tax=Edwardsiella tarda TaxID=636 RepID=UPI003A874089
MNNLISSDAITMSSVEIAELTGKEHRNVLADIRKMLAEIQSAEKSADYKDSRGRRQPCLLLNRDESLCLISGYSAPLRMAIIKRWDELERRASQPSIPQTLPEALRLAADLAEKKAELENQLAIAAPKVDFADRVSEAGGVLIGNYAKAVGIGQNKLFAWLRDNGVLMAAGERRNVPRQEYLGRGYFTVKETAVNTNHGVTISFTSKITGKGQQWLTRKLLDHGLLKAIGEDAA